MKIKWYQFWKFNQVIRDFEYKMDCLSLKIPHSPLIDELRELRQQNAELKRKLNETQK